MKTSLPELSAISNWNAIPHCPLGVAVVPGVDPLENPILYRQIIAKRALIAGYEVPEQTAQTIADALADLRHLCDALGHDFAMLDHCAHRSYLEECDAAKAPVLAGT